MAKRKSGLGRGLAELLGEPREDADEGAQAPGERTEKTSPVGGDLGPGTLSPTITAEREASPDETTPTEYSRTGETGNDQLALADLPVHVIRPNPRQPRRVIEAEGLEELARSIAASGVVQPIIVRPMDDGYELIAGERRWRAAQMAGYTVVPAILRRVSDTESLEISLIENVVRRQLNPVDEAYALHVLLDDLGVTQEELSERVGKSRSAIANKLRLLDLPSEIQQMLTEGTLTEGHGRALLGLKSRGEQLRISRKAVAQGMSVRALESAVKKLAEGGKALSRAGKRGGYQPPGELMEETRERFYGRFEVVPRIKVGAKGGVIELPFGDEAELRRLLARLEG